MFDSRIVELSARIAANTTKVNDYLAAHNLPRPSFDLDAPVQSLIPSDELDIASARQAVIHDCLELHELMLGPKDHLVSYRHNELISQHAILRFRLAEAFPIGGETTFAELAAASGLNETHVRKLLRHAMTQHIFHEPRPEVAAHTAASRLLVEDKGLYNWLRFSTDDLWHAAYHTGDAMAKYPGHRAERFVAAMRFFTERLGLEPHHVVNNYPWNEIREDGTIVDIGGSHGIICIELARRFEGLQFVVQDLDEPVIREAERQRPVELVDRVKYMVHDFFTEQPINGADIYFLRAVLHNWSDKYAVKILRNLIPALKPGAKIILNETVIPEPKDVPPAQALRLRANDLVMIELQNGDDREMGGWERLFAKAHSGFCFRSGKQPPGSALWTLEAEWIGE
ncbi:S-adenosyl-L-methionine-dependent methyltransferase [Hypoxylon sp. EC38]|nr:S-adenosyl-L-methionine-dependent methyltransferase [Hypoxylon sp. EC38]